MKTVKLSLLASCLFASYSMVYAAPLKDLSGKYKCTITDLHDGVFIVTDVFTLDKKHSTNKVAGYNITILNDKNEPSDYFGFASFDGKSLAMYSANKDAKSDDYAVITSQLTKNGFHTQYYQPTYNGGNTGSAKCVKISN